jgi:hypothetical protein
MDYAAAFRWLVARMNGTFASPNARSMCRNGSRRTTSKGFFLNMGDMLVKSGDWQTAQKVYANARLSRDYGEWKFKATLEERIVQAQANVVSFNASGGGKSSGDAVIMNRSRFACMACHQQ